MDSVWKGLEGFKKEQYKRVVMKDFFGRSLMFLEFVDFGFNCREKRRSYIVVYDSY